MLFDELQKKKHEIESFTSSFGGKNIRVFGSVARGEETQESDIDFLVDFPRGYDMFTQRLALAEELSILTGRKVEIIPRHELNKHIKDFVIKEARSL